TVRVGAVVAVSAVLLPGALAAGYIGAPGWNGSPMASARLAECVRDHSAPGDPLLALTLEDLVTDADRRPISDTALGVFSYESLSVPDARELKVLNATILLDMLRRREPRVVVMTNVDRSVLRRTGFFSTERADRRPIDAAIASGYTLVCTSSVVR